MWKKKKERQKEIVLCGSIVSKFIVATFRGQGVYLPQKDGDGKLVDNDQNTYIASNCTWKPQEGEVSYSTPKQLEH